MALIVPEQKVYSLRSGNVFMTIKLPNEEDRGVELDYDDFERLYMEKEFAMNVLQEKIDADLEKFRSAGDAAKKAFEYTGDKDLSEEQKKNRAKLKKTANEKAIEHGEKMQGMYEEYQKQIDIYRLQRDGFRDEIKEIRPERFTKLQERYEEVYKKYHESFFKKIEKEYNEATM